MVAAAVDKVQINSVQRLCLKAICYINWFRSPFRDHWPSLQNR